MMPPKPKLKPLVWISSAKKDLLACPADVQQVFGYALHVAQEGGTHRQTKAMKGFGGAGVLEIIEDDDGNTFRAVYTVKLAGTVYVLHVFQKKSRHGVATPKQDIDLIKARLRIATENHQTSRTLAKIRTLTMARIEKSSGNVFEDLGFPDAATHQIKAALVSQIAKLIDDQGLSQTKAAERMGMAQPDVSKMLRGLFRPISLERLLQCVTALGGDVEISVNSPRAPASAGRAPRIGRLSLKARSKRAASRGIRKSA